MSTEEATTIRELTVELPPSAPLIRVTAGYGSAGQKTWNLRRPVTVIGSRRPAHIVLHDQDVSNAHCVIINTGSDVLVKDLHTSGGTLVNKKRVDLCVLGDGDVITLGDTQIQVAIQVPEGAPGDSGCGLLHSDPARFAAAVKLELMHTDKEWSIEDAAVLIGRHDDAGVRLDHPDLSSRHAVLFKFAKEPAVFDLGSRTGLWVNGERCSLTPLHDGDRLTVGPFGLLVHAIERTAAVRMESSPLPAIPDPLEMLRPAASASATASAPAYGAGATAVLEDDRAPGPDPLQKDIGGAWQHLNSWRTQLRHGEKALEEQQQGLTAREAGLDARDAALRGQLHDVTRFTEQVVARERELAARAAQIQAESDVLEAGKTAAQQREADLDRREKELASRDHALAQRWSRLLATTCPHCRKPINVGNVAETA